jgi:iron complex transport system substrate-binding protein
MKKFSTLFLTLILTLMFALSGCGQTSSNSGTGSNSSSSQKPKTITVKDSKGGSVMVPFEPKRVVVMNNAVAEIIYVLGGKDKIVGVSNDLKFPEDLAKKPKVGKAFTPDIEKVMEMKC